MPSRKACGFDNEVDERSGNEVACFGRLRFMGTSSQIHSAEICSGLDSCESILVSQQKTHEDENTDVVASILWLRFAVRGIGG